MSPKQGQKTPRKLVLNRETLRNLQNQKAVKFGPETSETEPCCTVEETEACLTTL